jgi:ATP-dependent Clp protease protease subunit
MPEAAPGPTTHYLSFTSNVDDKSVTNMLGVLSGLIHGGATTVHLLISSGGGFVGSGIDAFNVLRSLPIKLITHNVGIVASIANVVFLAGEERYASPHSSFMTHGVTFTYFNGVPQDAKALKERLASVQADNQLIAEVVTARTKLSPLQARKLLLEETRRDPAYALKTGFIHDIRESHVPEGAPFIQLVPPA